MALITKAIKGTQDVLPSESHKNQFIESTLLNIAKDFGFREIRTPVFEHTELFNRGVGGNRMTPQDLAQRGQVAAMLMRFLQATV